jgi:hypothetical protein
MSRVTVTHRKQTSLPYNVEHVMCGCGSDYATPQVIFHHATFLSHIALIQSLACVGLLYQRPTSTAHHIVHPGECGYDIKHTAWLTQSSQGAFA